MLIIKLIAISNAEWVDIRALLVIQLFIVMGMSDGVERGREFEVLVRDGQGCDGAWKG